MRQIGVGILGFGTVGAGVAEGLLANGQLLADRTGMMLTLRRIADLDIERDRGVSIDPALLITDAASVVDDPDVDVIVELIGGTTVAKDLILRALARGKPVVTANKALLAHHGAEIYAAAEKGGADLFFEASVGGGIPVIRAFREGLIGNHIFSIYGILNGTCNYILTRMEQDDLPFDAVLQEAQDAGFAEAEPGLDIDGIDTAHKAVVLASLAYGFPVPFDALHVEGIRGIDPGDIAMARKLGYGIKLLAVIKDCDGRIDVRVHPTLVPSDHLLASVHGVFNAVMVDGDVVGETLYYGKGAGREPTASAVIGDLVDVARNLLHGSEGRVPAFMAHRENGTLLPMSEVRTRYYLRLSLLDQPGVFARVSKVLGDHQIGIASLVQQEYRAGEYVPVVIVTHHAQEANFQNALAEIGTLGLTNQPPVRYRIESFEAAP